MIRCSQQVARELLGKPRASGDDPNSIADKEKEIA